MRFGAIDVETANANMASICAIGAAAFVGGELADEWYAPLDPQDCRDRMNVSIHGMTDSRATDAGAFSRVSCSSVIRVGSRCCRRFPDQAGAIACGDPPALQREKMQPAVVEQLPHPGVAGEDLGHRGLRRLDQDR